MQHRGAAGLALIALFARHRTAANLLMALMILSGIFGLSRLNTQFFPDFGIDIITISVAWPGASAEDVDTDIVAAIEPEVRYLDDVRHVRSTAIEGLAAITVEFDPGSDMQKALAEVEAAVAQVTTLPADSETPIIKRLVRYDTITRLLITGPYPEATLKQIGQTYPGRTSRRRRRPRSTSPAAATRKSMSASPPKRSAVLI